MPALTPDIENRVRKLPKPSNATQSLQPLFEAVSNAVFAIEDVHGDGAGRGSIRLTVTDLGDPGAMAIEVEDDGIGLDDERYQAFCTIDTDFKRNKGGKGVGRLFWLDAFSAISVDSSYRIDGASARRAFEFVLDNREQILPAAPARTTPSAPHGTRVRFQGLRTREYADPFPKRVDTFLRYFSAHFIADFLMGGGPTILVEVDGETTEYPKAVSDLVVGRPVRATVGSADFGTLTVLGFFCRPEASTGLEGLHQLHLLANGRTVESRKVDNLLGVECLERDGERDLAFHGCVSGEYLDLRVNEGRTAFNLAERTLKQVSRECMEAVRSQMIPDQVGRYFEKRRERYESFVERYPTYGFDDDETQLGRVPLHAASPEEFASFLVKFQIRRDEERQGALQRLIDALDLAEVPFSFGRTVTDAAREIQAAEQLALAQHVVRRKLALELLEKLIGRIRKREGSADDFHLERTLHSFICPMNVRGDDGLELRSRAHELWMVDERLAFTRAFSSDRRLDDVLVEGGSADRPDLFLWNLAYGLSSTDPDEPDAVDLSEPLRRVMVVEFKKPGRRTYGGSKDQVEQQITRYLAQLQGGEIESFGRARVRIARDCVFHCYVVADIVGDLEQQLSSWETTANGQGRIRPLRGAYSGQIEVIQWQDLINDAWMRNQATLHAAGLSRRRLTPLASGPDGPEPPEDDPELGD